MIPIKKIRTVIEKHHGGMSVATDQQIMKLWDSLDDDTRHRYLAEDRKLNQESKKNAVGDRHKSNI